MATPRRPLPPMATGRKPQTGRLSSSTKPRGPVLGPYLSYLLHLAENDEVLRNLAAQELALQLKSGGPVASRLPSPFTASIRLNPDKDTVLRLDADAISRLASNGAPTFSPTDPAVSVSLEFLGSREDLPPLGVVPAAQAGDLFVGWVNLNKVLALTTHPAVVHVEVMRAWSPTSDIAAGGNGGSDERSNTGETSGRGVRIAVIDLGFDFLHPGLLRDVEDGEQVRTLWLHDMWFRAPDSAPPGAIGRRFSSLDLEDALRWYRTSPEPTTRPGAVELHLGRLENPPGGNSKYRTLVKQHGTAVAGIAAGNGRGSEGGKSSAGVAPQADLALIAVGGHDEHRFADSIEICAAFQVAFEDTRAPCVALMANSDNLGPHDGSMHGERFLDELLLQPGRAVVLTAGNLNHSPSSSGAWHAAAQLEPNGGPPLPLVLRYGRGGVFPDSAEVWFRPPVGAAASCTVSMEVRDTSTGPAITATAVIGESETPVAVLTSEQNPKHKTSVDAQLQHNENADGYCLRLVFRPAESEEIVPSTWNIAVAAEGPVHAWLDRNNNGIGRWDGPPAQAGAGRTTLGSPAGAARALAIGSVSDGVSGLPSTFSGRGPLRVSEKCSLKPDLMAVGEKVSGPVGDPVSRFRHQQSSSPAYAQFCSGTSYAAPQVAGACALLFERFGSAATWADIRHAILQAAVRKPGMPEPIPPGWDNACGYGLLDLEALLAPPAPALADLWLPKAAKDTGTEPFVAETFWNSPAVSLEDATGRILDPVLVAADMAIPTRVRVRVANRGAQPSRAAVLRMWWAPVGAVHPLPHPVTGGGAWQQTGFSVGGQPGNLHHLQTLAPGDTAEEVFDWAPPRGLDGRIIGHVLLAAADTGDDPYDEAYTVCEQNNAALLSVAAARDDRIAKFQILGSQDTDGLVLWRDDPDARFRMEGLPVTALPWRNSKLFEQAGRSDRPLYGAPDEAGDVALGRSDVLETRHAITAITDVLGAERLELENELVTIDATGRLMLPRLRIRPGHPLPVHLTADKDSGGAFHLLHLSGGRRVGGGTVLVPT